MLVNAELSLTIVVDEANAQTHVQTKKGLKETTFLCATIPKFLASANIIRRIVHAEWGIENNGKELKDNWFMTHNFHHHPNATFAVLLIMFMVYNLFYAYVKRQMTTYRLYNLTQKEVIQEFLSITTKL